ncbi:MAG: glucan 1,4-alpha-glucosidase [Verrucomicrobiae bacterium]|nr:glucan 1,4-alpha-glucosidase [Verrucomicrobiae bacterium]
MDLTSTPPGYPGLAPTWTSSAKAGVGTAIANPSRVWFTISHGILNEIYFPSLDQANTRDFGFIVTDGKEFFSEEKRHTAHCIEPLGEGVAGYRLVNTCCQNRYRITKIIITDPQRDVLVQKIKFEPLQGNVADYHLYALLAPHLDNQGSGNNGWLGDYKGVPMLFAQYNDTALALACSVPWLGRSCGYVGASDGWQDLQKHKKLTQYYPEVKDGNIALVAEVDWKRSEGECVIVLGLGSDHYEAGQEARASLLFDFDEMMQAYISQWKQFQNQCRCRNLGSHKKDAFNLYRVSTAVLETHKGKKFEGGIIASLSIPWGDARQDKNIGGYHLVWARDQVEAATAFLAAGNVEDARDTLFYLMCTQEADGHWPQNMWLNGKSFWHGIQMDETAFVILLADLLRRYRGLGDLEIWPMIRQAAQFIIFSGPATMQDRWERNTGFSPFTLATEVAALLAAADFAEEVGEDHAAEYLRQIADIWNTNIEQWTYAANTSIAQEMEVDGYYVWISSPKVVELNSIHDDVIPIKNLTDGEKEFRTVDVVSPDFLGLVHFGLRAANDPRIVNTIKVVDHFLKTETATGPVWHRYRYDGYGEHDDGSPYDGSGKGRGWPLLTGERAHYEIAAKNFKEVEHLLKVMSAQTSPGGFFPEQIWDGPDIPERELFNGHPSGSAMPLVWAHAEYIKLLRSIRERKVFDMPPQPVKRYQIDKVISPFFQWRFDHACAFLPAGKILKIELKAQAKVCWTVDAWNTVDETSTRDSGFNIHFVDLPTEKLEVGGEIEFTFYWLRSDRWEGKNFKIQVR